MARIVATLSPARFVNLPTPVGPLAKVATGVLMQKQWAAHMSKQPGIKHQPSITALVPHQSHQLLAERTRDAYRRDQRYFWAWYRLTYKDRELYPVPVVVMTQFIYQHSIEPLPENVCQTLIHLGLRRDAQPWRHSTLQRRLAALAVTHNDKGLPSPTMAPSIKQLMRRIRRNEVLMNPKIPMAAITREELDCLVATCAANTLHDRRDLAILLVGFSSGGRRRSELIGMRYEHLVPIDGGYRLRLPLSKTDQQGVGHEVPILGAAALALDDWLNAAQIKQGWLFRGIQNNGQLLERFSGRGVLRMIKRRAILAGMDPLRFTAHSLRSGFVTECSRQGIAIADIKALTLHRTDESVHRYCRPNAIVDNPAAHLLNKA